MSGNRYVFMGDVNSYVCMKGVNEWEELCLYDR